MLIITGRFVSSSRSITRGASEKFDAYFMLCDDRPFQLFLMVYHFLQTLKCLKFLQISFLC